MVARVELREGVKQDRDDACNAGIDQSNVANPDGPLE